MLEINFIKLIFITAYTIFIVTVLRYFIRSEHDKNVLTLIILGFFLYSGIALSDEYSPIYLIISYVIFTLFALAGYISSKLIFTNLGKWISYKAGSGINQLALSKLPLIIIILYMTIKLSYLVFPDFKLFQLFNPPMPDVKIWFDKQFAKNESITVRILQYLEVLILPFYYFSLYKYRNNFIKLSLAVLIPLYFSYVANSYIGRYELIFALLFLTIVAWNYNKKWRVALASGLAVLTPGIVIAANAYTNIRLGIEYFDYSFISALYSVFNSEFSFPLVAGIPLIESGQTVEFSRYINWVMTLPIPSFLRVGVDTVILNYEMSEIALGVKAGDPGFYVLLPGLLAESYFIYGPYFYWAHALFIGALAAFYTCITERIPSFKMIYIYICLLLFLNLNRGGISSVLPALINGFLLFFLVIFILSLRINKNK